MKALTEGFGWSTLLLPFLVGVNSFLLLNWYTTSAWRANLPGTSYTSAGSIPQYLTFQSLSCRQTWQAHWDPGERTNMKIRRVVGTEPRCEVSWIWAYEPPRRSNTIGIDPLVKRSVRHNATLSRHDQWKLTGKRQDPCFALTTTFRLNGKEVKEGRAEEYRNENSCVEGNLRIKRKA